MTVIPAINAPDFETAKKQIETAAKFSEWIHVDVTDGVFSPAQIWGSPEELAEIGGKAKFEVHLMVASPEGVIDAWLRTGLVKRVIVHLESMTDSVYILAKCKKYGAEAVLAISPGTEVERLLAHRDDFKYFQILAVTPGWAGQKFNPKMLEKVKFIRKNIPNAIIEIDGGVNSETAPAIKKAGGDLLVSASYIFRSKDPRKAYEDLNA